MASKFRVNYNFPAHENYKSVETEDYTIGEGKDLIRTDGVNTCLAITLYDTQKKKGALAHITGLYDAPEKLIPENIIDTLLGELCNSENLEVTLSGEGLILVGEDQRSSSIVRKKLQEHKIPIVGEELNLAPFGKLVFLDCDTGNVDVYIP
jgi:chemotaxis receptor (MCP) glutamine deamidase CheD